MFDFENKPVKDWTLAEAKEYCLSHANNPDCHLVKACILNNSHVFVNIKLEDNTIPNFTPDEIASFRLIKKIYPWANYVVRNKFGNLKLIEFFPRFDEEGNNKVGTTGYNITLLPDFFTKVKPLTYYAIDDIIEQGENNNA